MVGSQSFFHLDDVIPMVELQSVGCGNDRPGCVIRRKFKSLQTYGPDHHGYDTMVEDSHDFKAFSGFQKKRWPICVKRRRRYLIPPTRRRFTAIECMGIV